VFCTVANKYLRNVARKKQSFQVSDLQDQFGIHAAGLANDGNRRTNLESCAHSEIATNPWWAVDLEVPTIVVRVNLTNSDADGTRINFTF